MMDTDKLRSDIWVDLQDKISEIYIKYQERLYIKSGDIDPMQTYKQDDVVSELVTIMTNVLISQMGQEESDG